MIALYILASLPTPFFRKGVGNEASTYNATAMEEYDCNITHDTFTDSKQFLS